MEDEVKKLLLLLILVIAVALFAFPAPLSANGPTVEDFQLTAVCSDNPSETRCWEVTNPNSFPYWFQYYTYRTINNIDWFPIIIPANSTQKICLPTVDPTNGIITGLKGGWYGYIVWWKETGIITTTDTTHTSAPTEPIETQWVRTMPMTCWQVWVNEDNNFQFIFWYLYADNNWVRIYDMEDNLVFEVDLSINDPNLIVELPDGFYIVRTFHHNTMLQEFLIGNP